MELKRPKVGLAVFVIKNSKFVMMLRQGAHGAGNWGLPGGHLEFGETWERCAKRETMEETGVEIKNVRFMALTNDVFDEDKHYVTIFVTATWVSGELINCEPEKCLEVAWFKYDTMPKNLFLPIKNLLATYPDLTP